MSGAWNARARREEKKSGPNHFEFAIAAAMMRASSGRYSGSAASAF
jgi:hypothetical protein